MDLSATGPCPDYPYVNRFFTIFFWVFAAVTTSLRAELLERNYRKSFPAPAEVVVVDVARGMIEVATGAPGSEVAFEVNQQVQRGTKPAATAPGAAEPASRRTGYERIFSRMEPRYEADPKEVRMAVSDSQAVVFDWDDTLRMVILIKVTVPPGLSLEIKNVSAGVSVPATFTGNLKVESGTGSVFAQRIEGDFLARTDSGSVTVTEVTGRAELRSDSGMVLAGRLAGPASLRTSNGTVEVQNARGDLKVRGDDAKIIVGLSSPLPKSTDLRTSAGEITLNVDDNVPVTIDAATQLLGTVRVRGLEPVIHEGGLDRSTLAADFSGGGPLVKVRTSGASVAIVGRDPLDG